MTKIIPELIYFVSAITDIQQTRTFQSLKTSERFNRCCIYIYIIVFMFVLLFKASALLASYQFLGPWPNIPVNKLITI